MQNSISQTQFDTLHENALWCVADQACNGQMKMLVHKVVNNLFTTQIFVFESQGIEAIPIAVHNTYRDALQACADQMYEEHQGNE